MTLVIVFCRSTVILLVIWSWTIRSPHTANMGYAVSKEYRGIGIVTAPMEEMLKRARKKYDIGIAGIFGSNAASKKLLAKFGFRRWGDSPRLVRHGKLYMDNDLYCLWRRRPRVQK